MFCGGVLGGEVLLRGILGGGCGGGVSEALEGE